MFFIASVSVLFVTADDAGVGSNIDTIANHDQIIMGMIALIGTSIAALVYTIRNNGMNKTIVKDTNEINKAVNNIGPGDHRLYDLISRIEEKQRDFDKNWGNLPPDMDDAVTLAETVHNIHKSIESIDKKLDAHIIQNNNDFKALRRELGGASEGK